MECRNFLGTVQGGLQTVQVVETLVTGSTICSDQPGQVFSGDGMFQWPAATVQKGKLFLLTTLTGNDLQCSIETLDEIASVLIYEVGSNGTLDPTPVAFQANMAAFHTFQFPALDAALKTFYIKSDQDIVVSCFQGASIQKPDLYLPLQPISMNPLFVSAADDAVVAQIPCDGKNASSQVDPFCISSSNGAVQSCSNTANRPYFQQGSPNNALKVSSDGKCLVAFGYLSAGPGVPCLPEARFSKQFVVPVDTETISVVSTKDGQCVVGNNTIITVTGQNGLVTTGSSTGTIRSGSEIICSIDVSVKITFSDSNNNNMVREMTLFGRSAIDNCTSSNLQTNSPTANQPTKSPTTTNQPTNSPTTTTSQPTNSPTMEEVTIINSIAQQPRKDNSAILFVIAAGSSAAGVLLIGGILLGVTRIRRKREEEHQRKQMLVAARNPRFKPPQAIMVPSTTFTHASIPSKIGYDEV